MATKLPKMRPLRVTKSVQNVNPIPTPRGNQFNKDANSLLKLKSPKSTRGPKGPFA
jgi:hypothetical protein